jgi:ribonucleotide monophosphatase NagD (HAD superfamily)
MAAVVSEVKAVLLDIQGTLLGGDGSPIAGAAEAVDRLRDAGLKIRFVTNIDSVPVAEIVSRLAAAGIPAQPEEVFSPISAAKRFLAKSGRARCHLLLPPAIEPEFERFRASGEDVDWVVVGDCRDGFTYERLNTAFRLGWNRNRMLGAVLFLRYAGDIAGFVSGASRGTVITLPASSTTTRPASPSP